MVIHNFSFFVLFSTLLSGTAAFTRTISDYLISMGLVKEKKDTTTPNQASSFCDPFFVWSLLFYFAKSNYPTFNRWNLGCYGSTNS